MESIDRLRDKGTYIGEAYVWFGEFQDNYAGPIVLLDSGVIGLLETGGKPLIFPPDQYIRIDVGGRAKEGLNSPAKSGDNWTRGSTE